MSVSKKFTIGAIGGLLPVLVRLLNVNLGTFINDFLYNANLPRNLFLSANASQVLILILLGGTMAALNTEVSNPLALVQLGVAAPALISSFLHTVPPKKMPRGLFKRSCLARMRRSYPKERKFTFLEVA
jgi:hypothetical protein